jgi:hypothetical protein
MDLSKIVGSTLLSQLTDSDKYPLLVIGKDRWSFQQVASDLGVIQARACRILSTVAKELNAKDVKHLYRETSPYTLAGTHGVGVSTLYVLLRVFQAEGLNVDEWYALGENKAIVTFVSLKHREQKAEAHTKESERKRRRLRSRSQVRDPKPAKSRARAVHATAH